MMQYSRLQGVEMLQRQFDQIPAAAQEQLGVELAIIGREIRDRQRALAPEDTGALRQGLSVQLLLEQLKVRVGIMNQRGSRRGKNNLFYGRIIEFGRRAQTVTVQRRRRVTVTDGDGGQRRILRTVRRRKAAADIVSTYKMKVKARAPHPFINIPDVQETAVQRLADLWGSTLAKAGA